MAIYPTVDTTSIYSQAGVALAQYAIIDSNTGIYPAGSVGALAQGQDYGFKKYIGVKKAGGSAPATVVVRPTGDNHRFKHTYQFLPAEIGDLDMDYATFNDQYYGGSAGLKQVQPSGTDWTAMGIETNAIPNQHQVCLIFSMDAQDADTDNGQQRWANYIYPLVTSIYMPSAAEEVKDMSFTHKGTPTQSAHTPWGESFTTNTWGFTAAARFKVMTRSPLTQHVFFSDGIRSSFVLNNTPTSDQTGRNVRMIKNGAVYALSNVTINQATKTVTFAGGAPAAGDYYSLLYESFDLN